MNICKFGTTGQDRKALVGAISAITNQPKKYLGTPSLAYQIGDITIDKHGSVTGELPTDLLAELAERGFQAEIEAVVEAAAPEAEATNETTEQNTETKMEENTALETEAQTEPQNELEEICETDSISITVPLDGFTPESIDNLCKMVIGKEPLIEKTLGVEYLPIRVSENGIEFPWFRAEHSSDMMAFAQFISALCTTAKEKKRVIAKPQEHFENERFTMRVWLIGLGLVGGKYGRIRQLLTRPLSGNGAYRNKGLMERTVVKSE